MALAVAAVVELVLGAFLVLLGRWGRLSADTLVPAIHDSDERRRRADSLARAGLFCQAIGLVLALFAIGTGIAAAAGIEPSLRPR